MSTYPLLQCEMQLSTQRILMKMKSNAQKTQRRRHRRLLQITAHTT